MLPKIPSVPNIVRMCMQSPLRATVTLSVLAWNRLPNLQREVVGGMLERAQALVFPKLYACPSGVSRDPHSGRCEAMTDPTQPIGGGAAAAPFHYQVERREVGERA